MSQPTPAQPKAEPTLLPIDATTFATFTAKYEAAAKESPERSRFREVICSLLGIGPVPAHNDRIFAFTLRGLLAEDPSTKELASDALRALGRQNVSTDGTGTPSDGNAAKVIAESERSKQLYADYPHRRELRKAIDRHDALLKIPLAQLRAEYIDRAKNGTMTTEDVWWAMCFSPEDNAFVIRLAVQTPDPDERRRAINYYIAEKIDREFGSTWFNDHGGLLQSLPCVLFPPWPELNGLNLRLLQEYRAYLREPAGGSVEGFTPSMLKPPVRQTSVQGGEAHAPLVQLPDGSWAADVSDAEAAWAEMRRKVSALERAIRQQQPPQHPRGRGAPTQRGRAKSRGRGARFGAVGGDAAESSN